MVQLAFNPYITTNAQHTFNVSSFGAVQGAFMDDPAVRNELAGGWLSQAETVPMWGGVPICEDIPLLPSYVGAGSGPDFALGPKIVRATNFAVDGTAAAFTGMTVNMQNYNWLNSPQSEVALAASGNSVNFFRKGSGARIWVQCDPSLVNKQGAIIYSQVSWDFNDSILQPYVASGGSISITSITWAAGVGTVVAGAAVALGLGDTIYISGATNSGTGGNAAVNGPFVINGYTDTTHFTIAMPAAAGVIATIAGTILATEGVGAMPVRLLEVQPNNCMVVNYNATTGFANYNRNGAAALILI